MNMTPASRSARSYASRLFLLTTGTAATIGLGLAGCRSQAPPPRIPPPPLVTVVESRRMTLPVIVNPIGTTRALEDETIRARVKGFLKEKHFQDGGQVKAGQLLLVIDPETYKVQLEQAEAQLTAAEAVHRKAVASKAAEVAKAQMALDRRAVAPRPGRGASRPQPPGAQGRIPGGFRQGRGPAEEERGAGPGRSSQLRPGGRRVSDRDRSRQGGHPQGQGRRR